MELFDDASRFDGDPSDALLRAYGWHRAGWMSDDGGATLARTYDHPYYVDHEIQVNTDAHPAAAGQYAHTVGGPGHLMRFDVASGLVTDLDRHLELFHRTTAAASPRPAPPAAL